MSQSPVEFTWNGRKITARPGDSVAAALYRVGVLSLASTRKKHMPLGYSGSFIGGVLARVDGRPNVRLDQEIIRGGMRIESQNHWPSAGFDLLLFARLIPDIWVYGGFEHGRFAPGGGIAYRLWEQLLLNLAGIAVPPSPEAVAGERKATKRIIDVLVVGGGPAGQNAANRAAAEGKSVALVTRGESLGRYATAMGVPPLDLDRRIHVFTGMELFGSYRRGTLLVGAPVRHDLGAVAFEAGEVVLATGKRSIPPMVWGNHVPGVMDAHTALLLAHFHNVMPGKQIAIVGTGAEEAVAGRLRALGGNVAFTGSVDALSHIYGRSRVSGIVAGRLITCDAIVHAGPWRSDPSLEFQSRAEGQLQLSDVMIAANIKHLGFAVAPDETIHVPQDLNPKARICCCMDVSAGELTGLIRNGETDPEILKRLTSCGMGPCQGMPCWESMLALLAKLTGRPTDDFVRPSHRAPRRAITVAQAAGLCDVVDVI